MAANTYLILLFMYFFVKFNLLWRTISYTTSCYCCTSGCSSWMCNCFDCGGSIELAYMQEQEEVESVSSQMDEVYPYWSNNNKPQLPPLLLFLNWTYLAHKNINKVKGSNPHKNSFPMFYQDTLPGYIYYQSSSRRAQYQTSVKCTVIILTLKQLLFIQRYNELECKS